MPDYQIGNPNRTGWQWIKQYRVKNQGFDPVELRTYIKDATYDPTDPNKPNGLAGWLLKYDELVKAEFWLSTFKPIQQPGQPVPEPIVTLVILLLSKGDPWEGVPGTLPGTYRTPPVPYLDKYFEPWKPGSFSFEMASLASLP